MGRLINRIPGLRLLMSSSQGSASITHVESLGKPCDSTSVLKALPGKLDIKRHLPSILFLLYRFDFYCHVEVWASNWSKESKGFNSRCLINYLSFLSFSLFLY